MGDTEASTFRENLRDELDYQGIKVKELSAKTGIPQGTVEGYLKTRSTMPSADAAVKIARALGVSVEYLVTGVEVSGPGRQAAAADDPHPGKATVTDSRRCALLRAYDELSPAMQDTALGILQLLRPRKPPQA